MDKQLVYNLVAATICIGVFATVLLVMDHQLKKWDGDLDEDFLDD